MAPDRQDEEGSRRRRRRRKRRGTKEGRDFFEFGSDDAQGMDDPREQRSVGALFFAIMALILILCATVIMRSCELETFPL